MTIISPASLVKAKKILFITHLAIGDFTYLQNFFAAFARQYPQLSIDLWIDELRRSSNPGEWVFLEKYALYDWAENCAFFHKVYRRTYSPALLQASIREARLEDYSLVVSLATLRPPAYARLARQIAPQAQVVGMRARVRWYAPWDKLSYKALSDSFEPFHKPAGGHHITEVYADWFRQLSGLELNPAQRFPTLEIPPLWRDLVQNQLQQWRSSAGATGGKTVFINAYAKTKKRCWPLSSVAELILAMRALPHWREACFIVNAMPQEFNHAHEVLRSYALSNTHLFSATDNFFQLPAMLERCDLIISVETAVMHLANAVRVPVIALMRQKNPEWMPIDAANSTVITTGRRSQWVNAITVAQVIGALP